MRWQGGKSGTVVRWQGGKDGKVMRWEGGRFLVLLKCGGRKASPRLSHPFLRMTITSHFNKTRNTRTNSSVVGEGKGM